MDKLPEPEFKSDIYWPRLLVGVDEAIAEQTDLGTKYFIGLAALTSLRYLREITFYKKNYLTTAIVIPSLILSSYFIGYSLKIDPYARAAKINNENELEYISKYKSLYREAKNKNIEIPDYLIL